MQQLLKRFWHDDRGAIISGELLLVATILGLGIIPGMVALRNGIAVSMTELSNAIVLMNGTGSTCADPVCTPVGTPAVIDVSPCP